MVSGRLLVNGNDFYIGNSTSNLSQLALKTDIPSVTQYVHPIEKQCNYIYTHPSEIQCNAASEINNLKTSVSNGKSAIASAITGKGVSTASDATFQTMANNINSIPSPEFESLFFSGQWVYMPGALNGNINVPTGLPRAFAFAPNDSEAYVYFRDSKKLYYWRLTPEYSDTQTLDTNIETKNETFSLYVPIFGLGASAVLTVDPINNTWYINKQCKTMFAIY